MARYRIHRMKDTPRESFRWAAHTGGTSIVKLKDYVTGEEIDAASPYAAWKQMNETERPLVPGDLLETVNESGQPGELHIAKYIGFERANWFVPEPKPDGHAGPNSISAEPIAADHSDRAAEAVSTDRS